MNELNALRDIHLPSPIGLWPLAIGWQALIIVSILLISSMIVRFYRKYQIERPKRQALILLKHYEKNFLRTGNSQMTTALISELLKRVALAYYPRKTIASLTGEAWIEFLNQSSENVQFQSVRDLLNEQPYQPTKFQNLTPLFSRAKQWIKQQPYGVKHG
jgi:hypothetical protein